MEKLKHLVRSQQLTPKILDYLFESTESIEKFGYYGNELEGKVMATLFYEPSTRTRFSFESAMYRLGGKVISTEAAGMFSSGAKGESLEDTIRIVDDYADVIVLRHPKEGASEKAAEVSEVPIINAGDGKGQHPTQALLDMYTIKKEIGRIDNIKVAMVGDLANGRTVRSLSYLLSKFKGIEIVFVSPEILKMKQDIKEHLAEHGIKFYEETDLNKILPGVDIVYMTRIQLEKMSEEECKDVLAYKGKYVITEDNLKLIKQNSRLLHPLPHVEEIQLSIETEANDPRVSYFRQAHNGLLIRMALLKMMLS